MDIDAVYTSYENSDDIRTVDDIRENGDNADKVKEIGSGKLNTEGKPVDVNAEVPADFAEALGASAAMGISTSNQITDYVSVFVNHVHNGKKYEYPAKLFRDVTGRFIVAFTAPNGFSYFTISNSSSAVANVGGTFYTDLQSAIEDVADGTVIVLTNNDNITAQIKTEKTITIDNNGHTGTVIITAGSGLVLYTTDKGNG